MVRPRELDQDEPHEPPGGPRAHAWREPVLAARGVGFAYAPGRPVLEDVSADIHAGCVTGVIGPNGAGKSTLLRILGGLLRPQRGRVMLGGRSLAGIGPRELAPRIAYLSQRPTVAFAFTVRQVVRLGLYARRGAEARAGDLIERALAEVDALGLIDRPFGALSVGQQQRVTLARALAQLDGAASDRTPGRILLADEPVSAMDPKHAAHTMALLTGLARSGLGVVIVLHDLTLGARALDRVVALDRGGRVLGQGPARSTLTPELLRELYDWPFRWVETALVPESAAGDDPHAHPNAPGPA